MVPDSLETQIALLDRWRGQRIVVAGDFILDHYIYGNAERLSPDAPVPVLALSHEDFKPGGSSNVALDLQALRCRAVCIGVVGRDAAAKQLRGKLRSAGCDVTGLITVNDRPTTLKQNYVGLAQHRHPQKMFRVDNEERKPITGSAAKRIIAAASRALKGAAALCLEDYNKGVLTPEICSALIKLARKQGIPVLVDPAAIWDYSKYSGATCITPNRIEAALGAGIKTAPTEFAGLAAMAKKLRERLKLDAAVLTLDKQGVIFSRKGSRAVHIPTVARDVYDVTGAGDMLLAVLAAALANGADWHTALALANTAAGLEVEKFGVVPIPLEELLLHLVTRRHETAGKIRVKDQLLSELAAHKSAGRRIVFTNGCFDLLHAGHVAFLRAARTLGDLLVVGINSDASIRRIKGAPRPIMKLRDRLTVLSELQSVDYLVVFDEDTPDKLIRAIRPEVLAKGAEHRRSNVVGAAFVRSYGGQIKVLNRMNASSITRIIKSLLRRD